jgi:hypothetical protein
MKQPQTNIRLDDQAKTDALTIMERYNIRSLAAAIRLALRELAQRIEDEERSKAR